MSKEVRGYVVRGGKTRGCGMYFGGERGRWVTTQWQAHVFASKDELFCAERLSECGIYHQLLPTEVARLVGGRVVRVVPRESKAPERKSVGQVAFEAYEASLAGSGYHTSKWDREWQNPVLRRAWDAVFLGVADEVRRRFEDRCGGAAWLEWDAIIAKIKEGK